MMSFGRGRAGSNVPAARNDIARCPSGIGVGYWGAAAVVVLCLWTSWPWRHWFQPTSLQAVKCVSDRSFVSPSPKAFLPRWYTCTPFAQLTHINLWFGVAEWWRHGDEATYPHIRDGLLDCLAAKNVWL